MSALLDSKPSYVYFAAHSSEKKVKIGSSHKVFSRLKGIKGRFDLQSVIALEVDGRKNAYNLEFMFIRKFSEFRTHPPYDYGISGRTDWFDKNMLAGIDDVLQDSGLSNKVRRIDNLWLECMKDAINPNGSDLPIKHLTGDKTIAHDKKDSIDLYSKLRGIVSLSTEYTVDCPYVNRNITRLTLKTAPENSDIFECFSDLMRSIECHPRFRSIGESIVHRVKLVNDGASILFSFAIEKPKNYSNECERAREEIYSIPINYIRFLSGQHKSVVG